MKSNMFANLENKFQFASTEEIIATARASMADMFDAMEMFNPDAKINVALIGVKLGTCGDGVLNEQEKMLIREIFGASVNIPMEQFYESLEGEITDELFNAARMLTKLGNAVAMPFLHYVLSFAYIDGVFEDEVAEELDGIFGMQRLTYNEFLSEEPSIHQFVVRWFFLIFSKLLLTGMGIYDIMIIFLHTV